MLPADHRLHPSRAGRWTPCPGSVYLESLCPNEANEASLWGDACHAVAANMLDPRKPVPPGAPVLTEEMIDVAGAYAAAVRAVGLPVFVESPVTCHTVHPRCKGAPDAFAYHLDSRTAYVWDLKTGRSVVEAEGNKQLLVYLSGITDWIAREQLPPPARSVATIVQPRAWHPDGPVRSWELTDAGLLVELGAIQEAAQLAYTSEPPLRTGPQCKNCNAVGICPAARVDTGAAQDTTGKAFPDIMPPEALAREILSLRAALGVLKPRLEALEARGLSLLQHGGQLPGFRLGRGRGSRRWTVSDAVLGSLGLTKTVPLSPNQAENEGHPKDVIKSLCVKQEGAPTLALGDAAEAARKVFA